MDRALVHIKSEADRKKIAVWSQNVPFGTTVEFRAPRRSADQNALMWSLLTQISKKVVWYGQKLSNEDWKDVLTASLRRTRVVPGVDPGSFVPLGMRTSQMTKAELSELMELIIAFGTQQNVTFREFADSSQSLATDKPAAAAHAPVLAAAGDQLERA